MSNCALWDSIKLFRTQINISVKIRITKIATCCEGIFSGCAMLSDIHKSFCLLLCLSFLADTRYLCLLMPIVYTIPELSRIALHASSHFFWGIHCNHERKKLIRKQEEDNKFVREIKSHMMYPHTIKVFWVKDYTGSRAGGHSTGLWNIKWVLSSKKVIGKFYDRSK